MLVIENTGSTLLDLIIRERTIPEERARGYIEQILSAVQYLHSLSIVHRDIKARNIVLSTSGPDAVPKLIDFGDSMLVHGDKVYHTMKGTLHYLQPECKTPRSGRELMKSDMWQIGIVLYLLVCGEPPWSGSSEEETLEIILSESRELRFP